MKYLLKDICNISAGGDVPKGHYSLTKSSIYSVPIYSNGIENEGLYGYTDKAAITDEAITISARGTIGITFRRTKPYYPIVRLISLIPKKSDINLDYLYYALKLYRFKKDGSVQQQLTVPMVGVCEVDLPDLLTQKRIASVLSNIDRKIALNRAMNEELEQTARDLYDYWFLQFDFPDANGKPYRTSGGKMVYSPQLKREIPEGWEVGKLEQLANITMGQSPAGFSYNERGEGMIFYQGSTDFGARFPSIRMFTTEPSRFAKKGDILMSVRAPVGTLNIANTDCCIGRGLAALNSKLGSMTHLFYVLLDLKTAFDARNVAGTTFGSITKDDLHNLSVLLPQKEIVANFETICSSMYDEQMKMEEATNSLTSLRDELLPLLMNGQVTIE